jgi:hypothetical protein
MRLSTLVVAKSIAFVANERSRVERNHREITPLQPWGKSRSKPPSADMCLTRNVFSPSRHAEL